jgi:excisionase family DNA binding protein
MPNETTLRDFIREILREELRQAVREILPQVLAGQAPASAPASQVAERASDNHQLWNAAQAADYLGVSTSWIYHRSAEGSIPCVRVGHALRFDPAVLAAWTRGERRGGRVVPLK